MKVKLLLILIGSILILQGCALFQTMKMTAVASPEQQVGYQETITSQKNHFVSLAPYRERNTANGNTSFVLFVKNCGEEPINISSDNVLVIFEGNTKGWESRRIAVLSFDDLMNELSEKMLEEFSVASLYNSTTYYEVYEAYGNNIRKVIRKRESPGYESPILALAYRQFNQQKALVEELVMKPQALRPGESGGGLVVCDTRDMNGKVQGNFKVAVSVNGEEHEFTFNRSLYK